MGRRGTKVEKRVNITKILFFSFQIVEKYRK